MTKLDQDHGMNQRLASDPPPGGRDTGDLDALGHRRPVAPASAPPRAPEGEYLSSLQVAQRLGVGRQYVYNLQSAGVFREGTHYFRLRPGGRPRYYWPAVEAWLQGDGQV
jgi:hypothetical protein